MSKRGLILFLLLGCSLHLFAQNLIPSLTEYGVEQGLAHRVVNCVLQDQQGYIWVGTLNGLDRFDGYQFHHISRETHALSSNYISSIVEDSEGLLWLFHEYPAKTIDLYDPLADRVFPLKERFPDFDFFDLEDINGFNGLISDAQGGFFLILEDDQTIFHYRPNDGFRRLQLERPFPQFERFWVAPSGHLLMNNDYEILQVDFEGKTVQKTSFEQPLIFRNETSQHGFFFYLLDTLSQTEAPHFWAYQNGAIPIPADRWQKRSEELPTFSFVVYLTREGLLQEFPKQIGVDSNLVTRYRELTLNNGLESIRCYYQDAFGYVWVGTNFGLFQLSVRNNKFQRILYEFPFDHRTNFICRGILPHGDQILINTDSRGLQVFYPETGIHQALEPDDDQRFSLIRTRDGKIFSAGSKAIKRLDSDFRTAKRWNQTAWSFLQLDPNRLLVGRNRGLFYLNLHNDSLETFKSYLKFKELRQARVVHLERGRENVVWICSNLGLFKLLPDVGIVEKYGAEMEGDFYLPSNSFYHLFQDEQGIIWLGTADAGLIRWDPQTCVYQQFTRLDGLSNDVVYAIYPDQHGYLWLATDFGINRFNKQNLEIKAYLEADGITHNEFNRTSHYQAEDGTIYFGGLNGVTVFHPNDFYEEPKFTEIPLVINRFQQFDPQRNKLIDRTASLRQSRTILLKPSDRYFHLEVALLSYQNADKIRYAWKIAGLDKEWIFQRDPGIRLSRIPFGSYELRIKGQNADGQWSSKMLTIYLEVPRPWYRKSWVVGSALFILLLVMYGGYQWRLHQYRLRQQELEKRVREATQQIMRDKQLIEEQATELRQLDHLKTNFFTNVSHELRTPLTLLLGPIDTALKSNRLDPQNSQLLNLAFQQGQRLLQLVGELLDLSKLQSGKIQVTERRTLIFPLLSRWIQHFEQFAAHKGIQLLFVYEATEDLIVLLDYQKMEKIVNNLLANALKFTERGGTVEVLFRELASTLILEVKDSGRGIPQEDLPYVFERYFQSKARDAIQEGGAGIGLSLSKEFARLMEGDLTVESTIGLGSTFQLVVPKKQVLSSPDASVSEETEQPEPSGSVESPAMLASAGFQVKDHPIEILIVEDHLALQQYLQVVLSKYWTVSVVNNGKEALEWMKKKEPTLILSDVMMPIMDGFQLLRALKSSEEYRHIPVIMITAKAGAADRLQALRIGVDDYLLKPFLEDELLARVDNLLRNYQARLTHFLEHHALEASGETSLPKMLVNEQEQEWLKKLEDVVEQHLGNFDLTVEMLASAMTMSRTQFFREVKRMTGLTPSQYLQEARFQKARLLLETHKVDSVKAAAYGVGFKQVKHFSRQFRKRFGHLPSAYL